jgi:hypothetical protein
MPSLERIAALSEEMGRELDEGVPDARRATSLATVLLLAVGSLDRRLSEQYATAAALERVQADLRAARSALERVDQHLHGTAPGDLRDDLREACRLVTDVTAVLLGALVSVVSTG